MLHASRVQSRVVQADEDQYHLVAKPTCLTHELDPRLVAQNGFSAERRARVQQLSPLLVGGEFGLPSGFNGDGRVRFFRYLIRIDEGVEVAFQSLLEVSGFAGAIRASKNPEARPGHFRRLESEPLDSLESRNNNTKRTL